MAQYDRGSLGRGQPLHMLVYIALILFFAFFYTAVVFNPQETADKLRSMAASCPASALGRKLPNISTMC